MTRKKKGCLFYGLIIGAILIAVLVAGAVVGLLYGKRVVDQLTDAEPRALPVVQFTDEQMDALIERVERFKEAVQQGRQTRPLELTADELNALIANHPDLLSLRNRIFVEIDGNRLKARMSFPAEELGLEQLRGRYVNADGVFQAALREGKLSVTADSLTAKGKPVPESVMRRLHGQNFADQINRDSRAEYALSTLQEIAVRDGKLVFVPKPSTP